MAVAANVTIIAGMNIVDRVTARASLRRVRKLVVAMTVRAGNVCVTAAQRVTRLAVIKTRGLPVG